MVTKKTTASRKRPLNPEVFEIIERVQNENLWLMAIDRLPEPMRTQKIEEKFKGSIEGYPDLDKALKLAKLLKRDLTTIEIEKMIDVTIENDFVMKDRVGMAQHLPEARRKIKLEQILAYYLKDGDYEKAEEAREQLGREFTEEELDTLFEAILSNAVSSPAPHRARPVALLFREPKKSRNLEKLLRLQIEHRPHLDECLKTTAVIGRKLTKSELSSLLAYALKTGDTRNAALVAKMLKRPLTVSQIMKVLSIQKEKGYYDTIEETIGLLSASHRKKEYERLIQYHLEKLDFEKADGVARRSKRRLTSKEIETLLLKLCSPETRHLGYNDHVRFICEKLIVTLAKGR